MKLKLLFIASIIVVFTFASICFSKQPDPEIWEFYGKDSKGGVYYCSKNKVMKSSGIITFRIYYSISDDERKERVGKIKQYDLRKSVEYQNYDHDISEAEMDCKNKLVMEKEFTEYDNQGNALKYDINKDSEWRSIQAQTVTEKFYNKHCIAAKKKTKKK